MRGGDEKAGHSDVISWLLFFATLASADRSMTPDLAADGRSDKSIETSFSFAFHSVYVHDMHSRLAMVPTHLLVACFHLSGQRRKGW